MATRQFGWAIAVTVFNAAFNLYPVMHQRYKRARYGSYSRGGTARAAPRRS